LVISLFALQHIERLSNKSTGNLSSERVSKREVFDVFHKFGRLAQISLKNAYGFVQYHTAAEGQYALQNAQGIELGGRKIRETSPPAAYDFAPI